MKPAAMVLLAVCVAICGGTLGYLFDAGAPLTVGITAAQLVVLELIRRRAERRAAAKRVPMRPRRCPECGMHAVCTEDGWRTHRFLCRQRVT